MLSGEFSRTGRPMILAVIRVGRGMNVRSSSRDGSKCEGSRQYQTATKEGSKAMMVDLQ